MARQLAVDLAAYLESQGTLSAPLDDPLGVTGDWKFSDVPLRRTTFTELTKQEMHDHLQMPGMPNWWLMPIETRIGVNLRYPRELRDDPIRLGHTLVATPTGEYVPLRQLAAISIREGAPVVKSENGSLLTNIPIDLEAGLDVGTYVERAQSALERAIGDGELTLPTGTYFSWSGQYQLMQQVRSRLLVIIPLTLAIILVLVYFNMKNLTETLIAMLTLPFALIGGVWLLAALDYDLSVAVMVGFIALAGLAAETAILMHVYLDIAHKKRAPEGQLLTGATLNGAVIEGAVLRVRPKMMTVVTTILALAPIMWATGAGSGPMKRMAAPMIGGLITSTLHTLILIPVYYAMFREFQARRANRRTSP